MLAKCAALALLAVLALTGCEDAPSTYCDAHPNNSSACR